MTENEKLLISTLKPSALRQAEILLRTHPPTLWKKLLKNKMQPFRPCRIEERHDLAHADR